MTVTSSPLSAAVARSRSPVSPATPRIAFARAIPASGPGGGGGASPVLGRGDRDRAGVRVGERLRGDADDEQDEHEREQPLDQASPRSPGACAGTSRMSYPEPEMKSTIF